MNTPKPSEESEPAARPNERQDDQSASTPEASSPSLRKWLKNAFSVDDGGLTEPTPEEAAVVDMVLRSVVKRGLTTPALLFIESSRPLNYIGAQALHFLAPMAEIVLPAEGYRLFTQFLERRASIDYLCRRLQELDDEQKANH